MTTQKTTNFRFLRHAGRPKPLAACALAALVLTIGSCASRDTIHVESANQDTRVRVVVIHHTTGDFGASFNVLTEPSGNPVSSHYLIPEPGDPSYDDKKLKLYSLVREEGRAWHAGSSYWAGRTSLNDMSIGIELVNQTYCRKAGGNGPAHESDEEPESLCFYPDFAESQLQILFRLLDGIARRHPEVKPTHFVGHADIAPQRKIDPGPRFPWQRMYRLGFGAWYDDDTMFRHWEQFRQEIPPVLTLQTALHTYGYKIDLTGENDKQSRNVVRAFQMHFLPHRVSGDFNRETAAVLYALLEKYYPEEFTALLADSRDQQL